MATPTTNSLYVATIVHRSGEYSRESLTLLSQTRQTRLIRDYEKEERRRTIYPSPERSS